jgi:hypothetical protein
VVPYTWNITGLPTGLSSSSSGTISGIPTVRGDFTIHISITDNSNPANHLETNVNLKIYVWGDANQDGTTNILDVTAAESMILGARPATMEADANGNGLLNMGDVVKIERIILGLDQP